MSAESIKPEPYLVWLPDDGVFSISLKMMAPPTTHMDVGNLKKDEVDAVIVKMLPQGRPAGTRYVLVEPNQVMVDFGNYSRFIFISW